MKWETILFYSLLLGSAVKCVAIFYTTKSKFKAYEELNEISGSPKRYRSHFLKQDIWRRMRRDNDRLITRSGVEMPIDVLKKQVYVQSDVGLLSSSILQNISFPQLRYVSAVIDKQSNDRSNADEFAKNLSKAIQVTSVEESHDPFELGEDGDLAKPEMLISDWIEMFLFAILLLIGIPLNAIALTRLLQAWHFGRSNSARTKQEVTRTSFLWLKIHLTVIDLLVISCYCPSHIAWLISYTWNGGEFLCKAMQYSWDFCFHLMSFGVVGIAVDRLRTVYGLMRLEKTGKAVFQGSQQLRFVRRLIISCYIGAAIFSVPQWFVWTTVDMRTWSQCTTIWHKVRALQYLENHAFTESFDGERIYTLVHLLTVFWIPFLILFVAYFYISVHLFYYSISTGNAIRSADAISDESTNESVSLWPNQGTTISTSTTRTNGKCSVTNLEKVVPAWRREMRSRMFHATVHVIAAYLVCWMPYNVLSLATFFSHDLQVLISTHLELLRVCVLLNTLLNPFIYGFKSVSKL